jgi:hypothetical protein
MKISSKIVAFILVTILFGGIGISKALGEWHTESTKVPAKYTSGEYAGEYNPEDIRGSFALQDISNSFDIPVEVLAKAFGVNVTDPAGFLVKDLGTIYADFEAKGTPIETASVRHFVALYKGLPYSVSEETYFPKSAVEILIQKGKLNSDQLEYLEKHTVEVDSASSITIEIGNSAAQNNSTNAEADAAGTQRVQTGEKEVSEDEEDRTIKGKTTFKEVLDWGVSKSDIEAIIGGKIPTTGLAIRDYCTQQGKEFSTIKGELQEKVDLIR